MQTPVKSKNKPLKICDCGLSRYGEVLKQQHNLQEQRRKDKKPNNVLIAEHYPVITFGARENLNRLAVDKAELSRQGIELVRTRRGGGVTAHNPGQLVIYPIIKLADYHLGITEYVRKLEDIGAELIGELGLECSRKKGYPGLWVGLPRCSRVTAGEKKVASIGVRVSRGVSFHGMAINISNDLRIFDLIQPCGLKDIEITSVYKETGLTYSMNEVKDIAKKLFVRHFDFKEVQYVSGRTGHPQGPQTQKYAFGNPQTAEVA